MWGLESIILGGFEGDIKSLDPKPLRPIKRDTRSLDPKP